MGKKRTITVVLIAEDDLAFTAPGAFRHYLQQIPADYDLYLGTIHSGKIQSDRSVRDFSGTALYMIHARFYDTFLSINENMNIDRALAGMGNLWFATRWWQDRQMGSAITVGASSTTVPIIADTGFMARSDRSLTNRKLF